MATEHEARTTPFGDRIGQLGPGKKADIVLLDWRKVTWPYQDDAIPPIDVLVHRARREAVDTVLIGGDVVYAKGKFTHVDRDTVLCEIANRLGERQGKMAWTRQPLGSATMI